MDFVKINEDKGIFEIILNRPEKHNSFHPQMIEELTESFTAANDSQTAKVVLLRGEGKSFCSGADLSWMQSMVDFNFEENFEDSKKLYAMFESAKSCGNPVIGKIHGYVMGGAVGLVSICDVVAAEENTKFGFTEVKLGLAPAVISPFVLMKMNSSTARELMLTGRTFDATEARSANLVNFVGSEKEVNLYIEKTIEQFLSVDTTAVRETKKLISKVQGKDIKSEDVKNKTCQVIAHRRVSASAQLRLRDFLEKKTK